ncbi:MAG: hypothetical protein Unbinned627contig1001_8 [Prokaryotic dsDNA virus sp.]|jgi:hypothetical protein|nr:MAG: hypothetical protein Unbinned627contig1001_8 [Prokaryotic dsDNA virus sp.]|tara:strand:+ start:1808 stop:2215 length:408 start_codon:yes stop_codon:yes gene_type:complete
MNRDQVRINKRENIVYYAPQIYCQKVRSFQLTYQYDPELAYRINLVCKQVKEGQISHWQFITHCINKEIPIFVKTKCWGEFWENEPLFIFAGLDDLLKDKTQVIVYSYRHEYCYTTPVGLLDVDVDQDYRALITS